ncbi:hypothetical protein QR680_010324 [Steinernema hermaphroditum]|uniref:F-box domain-containing protein n=1 Tax=Steinernema hermaphroditum TaxID=289476 RepID=A0AA39INK7_9BILA|nr:hypothetical protein QR680_010324 [Steinernema hermaphroditum]
MEAVPYVFCEEVLERLSKENLYTTAELSGQWKSAAQIFLDKRRIFFIKISKDDEGWWYALHDSKTWDIENGPHSHEEFLSMDRTHMECCIISVNYKFDEQDGRQFRCSKEEIARRVVPFLTLRMRPHSTLLFSRDCPKEIAQECLNMFRSCFSFGMLNLVYVGPESEEFLALQLKNNQFLCGLSLRCWQHTETTEQLLLTFLNSRKKRYLDITHYSDIQSPLKVTIRIVKAAVDSWVRGDYKRALSVYGNIGVTPAEILSIPLPENVAMSEEEGEEEGNFCVRWIKVDGSSLKCDVDFSDDQVLIDSSDSLTNWLGSPV